MLRYIVAAFFILFASFANGALPRATEYEVKAAFIYNFARFVEWPSSAFTGVTDPIRLCIFGEYPFGDIVDQTVRGKTVAKHPFVVLRIDEPQRTRDCHIVFVSRTESARLGVILAAVQDHPVMTIVDMEDAVQRGAILNFALRDGRVRFAVNPDSAQRSGLSLSSQLIKLAIMVASDTSAQ